MLQVFDAMFRVIKESENVDERQHCFLIQTFGQQSHYFSVETRQVCFQVRLMHVFHCLFTILSGAAASRVCLAQGCLSGNLSTGLQNFPRGLQEQTFCSHTG